MALLNAIETGLNPEKFMDHVRKRLRCISLDDGYRYKASPRDRGSVVLLPLTQHPDVPAANGLTPSLILNKRSERVRQPGDLCYPGGSIAAGDRIWSFMLRFPFLPLSPWPYRNGGAMSRKMRSTTAVLLATGLREAWEEMHMNPFRLAFMGQLPIERLVLFDRRIYPLVVWTPPRQHYRPNWEVQRIVHLPLLELLRADNYARYRPTISGAPIDRREEFPCFIHHGKQGREILWGVSYRITMRFLQQVFDFQAPALRELPVIEGRLSAAYLNHGRR
jgi:8-oxo-dGTP pyrophosphatase MutT (NUDIX family)